MKATKTIEMRQTDIRHAVRLLGLLSENEGDVTMIMRLIAEPLRRQVSAVMQRRSGLSFMTTKPRGAETFPIRPAGKNGHVLTRL